MKYENEAFNGYVSLMDDEQKQVFDQLTKIGDEKFTEDVFATVSARDHLIYMTCNEEKRLMEYFKLFGKASAMNVMVWDISRGLRNINNMNEKVSLDGMLDLDEDETMDEEDILKYIIKVAEKDSVVKSKNNGTVFLLLDYHRYLDDDSCPPSVERNLKNIFLTKSKVSVFLVGPQYTSTKSLDSYLRMLDFPYPSKEEILGEAKKFAKDIQKKIPKITKEVEQKAEEIVNACSGLTHQDLVTSLCQSVVKKRSFDIPTIVESKRQIIKKKGLLEYIEPKFSFADVGGLDPLIDWFMSRKVAMSDEALAAGVDPVRGALLVGVPGGGKSLIAKAAAAGYNYPCLRLDFGTLFSSLQGDTEHNLREAIKLAEAMAPCVLWVDELEKGTSGTGSSNETDGGTTARVMQSLLTWMQEKTKPVFIIGTANNHEQIAPELLRRFDEVWFVDNPTNVGRKQIFEIQFKSRKIDYSKIDIDALVSATEGYNGDEIRALVNETLVKSIMDKKKVITTDDILSHTVGFNPLSEKKEDEIDAIRKWAKGNCKVANTPEDQKMKQQAQDNKQEVLL